MTTIHFDAWLDDRARQERRYLGDLFVYGPTPETLAFKDFARTMVEDAFGSFDPEMAQYGIVVEDYARLLGELKPRFIHHPGSKAHIQKILPRFGVIRPRPTLQLGLPYCRLGRPSDKNGRRQPR